MALPKSRAAEGIEEKMMESGYCVETARLRPPPLENSFNIKRPPMLYENLYFFVRKSGSGTQPVPNQHIIY